MECEMTLVAFLEELLKTYPLKKKVTKGVFLTYGNILFPQ